jgi:hypothetical protein
MTSYKSTVHLVVAVFHGGKVVFRDTLMYTSAIRRWSGGTFGGVAVPADASGASPLPSPEKAHMSLSIMVGGHLRCTLLGWRAKPMHISRRDGQENVRALRFERAGLGFEHAARVDVFADPEEPESADDATSAWRVSALVGMNDAFLRELLFP